MVLTWTLNYTDKSYISKNYVRVIWYTLNDTYSDDSWEWEMEVMFMPYKSTNLNKPKFLELDK